jgi:ATP-dependent Clp protease protease subunit
MTRINKTKKKKEEEEPEEGSEEITKMAMEMLGMAPDEPSMRSMMLYGDLDEEKALEIIVGLMLLSDKPKPNAFDEDGKLRPMNLYISTYGGNADDMFAIYDMMNITKEKCDIVTIGLGKVMSAGTLVLAAGTKGKRRITKHCRVMIHSVAAGSYGNLHNLTNEIETIKEQQDKYINALVNNTNMTKRQVQKLLDRKVNVYLSAAEAVEYGIADEII